MHVNADPAVAAQAAAQADVLAAAGPVADELLSDHEHSEAEEEIEPAPKKARKDKGDDPQVRLSLTVIVLIQQ